MMPFNLTVFFSPAMLVDGVRLYTRLTPRQIGTYGFILLHTLPGLLWLAFVVRNDWSAIPVLFGLVAFGIGQGALVTLLCSTCWSLLRPRSLPATLVRSRGTTQKISLLLSERRWRVRWLLDC